MKADLLLLAAGRIGPAFLRALGATWRLRQIDADGRRLARRHRAEGAIYALWHAQQLPLTVMHRTDNVAVIVSRHRDGEIISRIVERMGYRAIRGSSTRGGSEALAELCEAAVEGHPLAITTDGPQGPPERCKPGAIVAAARTGLPIIPAGAAAVRSWTFDSWDRFCVPMPGTTVYLAYGEPIRVPPDYGGVPVAKWQERVTAAQIATSGTAAREADRSRTRR